jgi:hypothetical protein
VGEEVRVQELPGHLGKFNGCWGTIESMEVDAEGRQWIIVKLDDNVRMLPVRCPPMSVSHANKPHEPARGESTQSSSLQWAPLSQVSLHAEFAERGVEAAIRRMSHCNTAYIHTTGIAARGIRRARC